MKYDDDGKQFCTIVILLTLTLDLGHATIKTNQRKHVSYVMNIYQENDRKQCLSILTKVNFVTVT